jgi:hypothetical protein
MSTVQDKLEIRFSAPGSLPRPGPVGRIFRLAMGALAASGALQPARGRRNTSVTRAASAQPHLLALCADCLPHHAVRGEHRLRYEKYRIASYRPAEILDEHVRFTEASRAKPNPTTLGVDRETGEIVHVDSAASM